MLHQHFCDEHLGDIDIEQLRRMLLSLSNTNENKDSIPEILGGTLIETDERLMVMAEFEYTVDTDRTPTQPTGRRCVGLYIMPEHDETPKAGGRTGYNHNLGQGDNPAPQPQRGMHGRCAHRPRTGQRT